MKLFRRNSKVPLTLQPDLMDCAPACLKMITEYYGRQCGMQDMRLLTDVSRNGVSLYGLSKAANTLGFDTTCVKATIASLAKESNLPCILHWNKNHYVILYRVKNDKFYIADPAIGYVVYKSKEFEEYWQTHNGSGVALFANPTDNFFKNLVTSVSSHRTWATLYNYVVEHKQLFFRLFVILIVISVIQFSVPFLTQRIVDKGILNKDLNIIILIAIGQFVLAIGRLSLEFIRSWILLNISLKINVALLNSFLAKLMQLPMSFFESKNIGDIFQRIGDHKRIEQFITVTTLSTIFSFFSLVVFSLVLLSYDARIFGVFMVFSILYGIWSVLFLKKRKELDYKRFSLSSKNQNNMLQIIEGMHEIKLNNANKLKKTSWENIQASLFELNTKILVTNQFQQTGAFFINEAKNILIVSLAAYQVVNGQFTLGTMMAVSYIIGQLNSPINQFVSLLQIAQDAKISMDRINEIHTLNGEDFGSTIEEEQFKSGDIKICGLTYRYPGAENSNVLSDITTTFEVGKVTAIVGTSGSGKTTLLKLLLKFYNPQKGNIKIGETDINNISSTVLRDNCGVVLQDGFIFSDTIARNIVPGEETIDYERLNYAIKMANLQEFIENLPSKYESLIGNEGNGISQGQKQRILIARTIYKSPEYIFFDEATNSLDANNERIILNSLQNFFKSRTVIVVAHRLSTVKNADKIIVLEHGRIIEEGTHCELIEKRGKYYELVKNQLELSEV